MANTQYLAYEMLMNRNLTGSQLWVPFDVKHDMSKPLGCGTIVWDVAARICMNQYDGWKLISVQVVSDG